MFSKRRTTDSMRKRAERWQREDEAERLRHDVASLESLSIEMHEHAVDDGFPPLSHTRRIPVEHAPALFEIPCCERKCEEGGYDITSEVLEGLHEGRTQFEGTSDCPGTADGKPCHRRLRWTATAQYAQERADAA